MLKTAWYWFARWGCRIFCILFFGLRIYGKENIPKKGAFLLVSNHQSYLDPVFCGAFLARRLHYLARSSLFANRLFAMLISSLNAIPLRRGEADLSAMRGVIDRLRHDKAVCLFPEGTRTADGRIAAIRAGFGLLARRADAAIVPMVIDGAFECWPRHRKMFSLGGQIVVWYGKALTAEQVKAIDDRKLAELLTDRLRQMQTRCRLRHGKKPFNYEGLQRAFPTRMTEET